MLSFLSFLYSPDPQILMSHSFFSRIDQFRNNYSLKSWSSIFHILCMIWLSLRATFWISTILTFSPQHEMILKTLYWIPCPFEYGSFMLLPLFFAQVLYPREWRVYAPYIFPIFSILVLTMTLTTIVWVYFTINSSTNNNFIYCINAKKTNDDDDDEDGNCSQLEFSTYIFRWFTASIFVSLAALQGLYSIKLLSLDSQQYMRFLVTSPEWIGVLNCILFISFASRGIYQLFAIFDICQLPNIPLLGSEDIGLIIFICFEMWYVIPTVLLVTTLTGKSIGQGSRSESFEITYGYVEQLIFYLQVYIYLHSIFCFFL